MGLFVDKFKPVIRVNLTQPINRDGSVSVSGNGARYSAESIIALKRNNALTQEAITTYKQGYSALEREPGLLMRTPANAFGQQSIDDTIGAITADSEIGTGFAKRWLKYGREKGANDYQGSSTSTLFSFTIPLIKKEVIITRRWLSPKLYKLLKFLGGGTVKGVYNNINPRVWNLPAYLWRMNQLVTHAKIAAGERLSLFNKLYWALVVHLAKRTEKRDADGWMLTLQLVRTAKGVDSRLMQWARKGWIAKFKEVHPTGGQSALEEYGWKNHPNAIYLENEFGE